MLRGKDRLTEKERDEVRYETMAMAKHLNLDEKQTWRLMKKMAKWAIALRPLGEEALRASTLNAEDYNLRVGCAA